MLSRNAVRSFIIIKAIENLSSDALQFIISVYIGNVLGQAILVCIHASSFLSSLVHAHLKIRLPLLC